MTIACFFQACQILAPLSVRSDPIPKSEPDLGRSWNLSASGLRLAPNDVTGLFWGFLACTEKSKNCSPRWNTSNLYLVWQEQVPFSRSPSFDSARLSGRGRWQDHCAVRVSREPGSGVTQRGHSFCSSQWRHGCVDGDGPICARRRRPGRPTGAPPESRSGRPQWATSAGAAGREVTARTLRSGTPVSARPATSRTSPADGDRRPSGGWRENRQRKGGLAAQVSTKIRLLVCFRGWVVVLGGPMFDFSGGLKTIASLKRAWRDCHGNLADDSKSGTVRVGFSESWKCIALGCLQRYLYRGTVWLLDLLS